MDKKEKFDKIMKIALDVHKKLFAIIIQDVEPSISQSSVYLLAYIRIKGNCTVTEIANYLEITLSAVTSLVDKLCKTGLVMRFRNDEDRRVVFMKLTEKGEKVLGHIDENKNRLFEKVISILSIEEINNFFGTIEKITQNILDSDISEKSQTTNMGD